MDGPTPFDLPLSKFISLLGSIANIFPSLSTRPLILSPYASRIKKEQGCLWNNSKHQANFACGFKTWRKYILTFHHVKKNLMYKLSYDCCLSSRKVEGTKHFSMMWLWNILWNMWLRNIIWNIFSKPRKRQKIWNYCFRSENMFLKRGKQLMPL